MTFLAVFVIATAAVAWVVKPTVRRVRPARTRSGRIVSFAFAGGVHGGANAATLIELLCAGCVAACLVAARQPDPVPDEITYVCWSSALYCQSLAGEARTQAIEALEGR